MISENEAPSDVKLPQPCCAIVLIQTQQQPITFLVPSSKVKDWHHVLFRYAASYNFEEIEKSADEFYRENKVPAEHRLSGDNAEDPKVKDLFSFLLEEWEEEHKQKSMYFFNDVSISNLYFIRIF
jgi:hypothetical protein